MSRTRFVNTKNRLDGKKQFTSLIMPSFSESSDDIVISINGATRLDQLAQQFFDDPTLWWVLAVYNNLGEPSLYVKDQNYLRIPADIQSVFEKINRVNR